MVGTEAVNSVYSRQGDSRPGVVESRLVGGGVGHVKVRKGERANWSCQVCSMGNGEG